MNLEFTLGWFVLSFCIYTLLRQPDEYTTRKLAERIDLSSHEVNPTITWLTKKIGLAKSFVITWIAVGLFVAAVDAYLEQRIPFILPLAALTFGFAHILASANNIHVGYILDTLGIEEFEKQHNESMRDFMNLNWRGKVRRIFHTNTEAFLISILAIPLTIALLYSLVASELFLVHFASDILLILPITIAVAFMMALLFFYPVKIIGPVILAMRFAKNQHKVTEIDTSAELETSIELGVPLLEAVLSKAREAGDKTVTIKLPSQSGAR